MIKVKLKCNWIEFSARKDWCKSHFGFRMAANVQYSYGGLSSDSIFSFTKEEDASFFLLRFG